MSLAVEFEVASLFNEELWYGSPSEAETAAEKKAAESIAAQVGRIIGAKPFPIAAQRLSSVTRDPMCQMHVVVEILESDPALSARLLRMVNSAGFALRTACTSVAHAAALVGIGKLNQVATTAAILDLYDSSSSAAANVLEHVTIVGALCRYLGVHFGLPPDELFTCGFLHDIGKLMLLDCERETYQQVLELSLKEPDIAHVKERELYGYDHALLAGHVLAAWNIPDPVPKVVAWHHQATRAYEDPLIARMVSVLRLADALSHALFRENAEFEVERLARTEAASYLDISEGQLAAMWKDMFVLAEKSRAGFRGEEPNLDPQQLALLEERFEDRDAPAPTGDLPSLPATRVPRNFPCVVCGVPSYANECQACGGYVCPSHEIGEDSWCSLCVEEYNALELKFPRWSYIALAVLVLAMFVGSVVGAAGAVTGKTVKLLVAPGLLASLIAVVLAAWHRWLRRMWFLRYVPDRRGQAPVVTDQVAAGVSDLVSLTPPANRRVINPFDAATESTPKSSRRPRLLGGPADDPIVTSIPPSVRVGASLLDESDAALSREQEVDSADTVNPERSDLDDDWFSDGSEEDFTQTPDLAETRPSVAPQAEPSEASAARVQEPRAAEENDPFSSFDDDLLAEQPPSEAQAAVADHETRTGEDFSDFDDDFGLDDAEPAASEREPAPTASVAQDSPIAQESPVAQDPVATETPLARAQDSLQVPPGHGPDSIADASQTSADTPIASNAAEPPSAAATNSVEQPTAKEDKRVTYKTPSAWKAVDGSHGSAGGW